MDGFDHLLNWQLKAGSHPFPGKDGGTCINEAALVAAGSECQPIRSVRQMPACFSRPICRLAMHLNDHASDEDRQRLLPYVTRLACADTPEIERERALCIWRHTGLYYFGVPFKKDVRALEAALVIGRQADPLLPQDVWTRMVAAKEKAASASPPALSLVSKIKSWLATKQAEPAA